MGLLLSAVNVIATSQAQFSHIAIVNSNGSAIHVKNSYLVLNSTVIDHCGFFDYSYVDDTVGGAVNSYNSKLLIVGTSVFSKNFAYAGGAIFLWQGSFEITGNTIFTHNSALAGGAISCMLGSVDISGNAVFTHNDAAKGGAVYILYAQNVKIGHKVQFNKNRAILVGGALFANTVTLLEYSGVYYNNTAQFGGAMALSSTKAVAKSPTTISGNHANISGGGISLDQLSTLTTQGFILENNSALVSGGGMHVQDSDIHINATAKLMYNSAIEGGGCYLSGKSRFYLASEANLLFGNNSASQRGGAIYSEMRRECQFYAHPSLTCLFVVSKSRVKIYIHLWNNSAQSAGDVLYGGGIEDCMKYQGYNIYNISNVAKDTTSLSKIASDPFRACFCNNRELQCFALTVEVKVYPGQKFNISVATVGQANGVVPSSVQAQLGPNSQATMGAFQNSQNTQTACTNLTFTLYSKHDTETITLTTGKCILVEPNLKLYIDVTLFQCPEGFELSDSPAQCICQERLQEYTKDCTIDDQKIHRTTNFWSGYDNATRGLILHPHCPFDYCTPPPNNFTMEHSDLQCSYNRTRLLCGQCQLGFSLALGTSRCLRCSDYYLALLPVFAVAGLALVVFLFACKLTLARGTINGLIFYANLIHTNRTIFFPMGKTNILTVFLAWLNLDFGLETCFYNGMDTYTRMWLQFAFPIYVWVLCGCIVLIGSKSYRMSRILGTNPVAVLATLFILSYTKLVCTAFSALSFTTLSYPQHNTKLVWLYDANIQYLHGKHIPLFVVGLAALLLCLPYTLLLLTSQWLRAWSNCRLFHWVNSPRVKFLLDAHDAPFKTKHYYWTGLLLLTRLVLYFVDAVNVLGNGNVNLLSTVIAVAVLSVWMGLFEQPYKSQLLGAIEYFFLLNVLILSVSTLYIRSTQGSQSILAYTSTALSLIMFVAILLFHAYLRIKHTNTWKSLSAKRKRTNSPEEADDGTERMVASQTITCTEVVIPRPTGYAERLPVSQMYNSERDIHQNNNSERQPLQQHERAPATPELSGSMDSCSSRQSWDNLSVPYTDAELREPLLSSDDYT